MHHDAYTHVRVAGHQNDMRDNKGDNMRENKRDNMRDNNKGDNIHENKGDNIMTICVIINGTIQLVQLIVANDHSCKCRCLDWLMFSTRRFLHAAATAERPNQREQQPTSTTATMQD
jgi:hypothetical protein